MARLFQSHLETASSRTPTRNRLVRPISQEDRDRWKQSAKDIGIPDAPWVDFLLRYFPSSFISPTGKCYTPAPFHHLHWAWVWDLERGVRPPALVDCWFRGASKTTYGEMLPAVIGALNKRTYMLYISSTQDQADDRVMNVAAKFDSPAFAQDFPDMSERHVNKYGQSQGWRRNRLRTKSGFTIDALGLDTTRFRSLKMDDQRPDMILMDDFDSLQDGAATIAKNINAFKRTILPAGSEDVAVVLLQNKIRDDGIMGQLVNGTTDFLQDRVMNGPIPALENLEMEERSGRTYITGGIPTWEGKSLARCQAEIEAEGPTAFLEENQHVTGMIKGGIFDLVTYQHCNPDEVPELDYIVVWVDPAVTDTDNSDAQGIQATGLDVENDKFYKLRSFEGRTSPEDALRKAIQWAHELGAMAVGVETDQGGDLWKSAYYRECENMHRPKLPFRSEKAGSTRQSKAHRVGQQISDYETGKVIHVRGTHHILEAAQARFPKRKPYDLADADFWAWFDLCRFREIGDESIFEEMSLEELTA